MNGDCTVCTVSLQPFEYDANEKYTHKFMVQSVVIPDSATQQEIDYLVMCFAAYAILIKNLCLSKQYGARRLLSELPDKGGNLEASTVC